MNLLYVLSNCLGGQEQSFHKILPSFTSVMLQNLKSTDISLFFGISNFSILYWVLLLSSLLTQMYFRLLLVLSLFFRLICTIQLARQLIWVQQAWSCGVIGVMKTPLLPYAKNLMTTSKQNLVLTLNLWDINWRPAARRNVMAEGGASIEDWFLLHGYLTSQVCMDKHAKDHQNCFLHTYDNTLQSTNNLVNRSFVLYLTFKLKLKA